MRPTVLLGEFPKWLTLLRDPRQYCNISYIIKRGQVVALAYLARREDHGDEMFSRERDGRLYCVNTTITRENIEMKDVFSGDMAKIG